jgi:DNA replication protein DnaC
MTTRDTTPVSPATKNAAKSNASLLASFSLAANRHDDLYAMLRRLNLSHSADTFAETALKAAKSNLSHEAFLYELATQECAFRTQRRIDRHLQESHLPREKTFTTLQFDRFSPGLQLQIERLRTGAFVEDAVNVVAVGRPGVGKSHLAAAIGHDLIQLGQTVLWTTTAALVQRLLAAKRDLRLPQQLAQLDHVACLILDDIGYVQHDRDEMEVLFTLLAERYERRSVILTTNLVFSEWNRIFKDPLTTMAAIDRVVHHSVILDLMTVESYRAQEAKEAQNHQPVDQEDQVNGAEEGIVATGKSQALPHFK